MTAVAVSVPTLVHTRLQRAGEALEGVVVVVLVVAVADVVALVAEHQPSCAVKPQLKIVLYIKNLVIALRVVT